MMLLQPTLEDMGFTLWGAAWREPMAASLDLTADELQVWEKDPLSIPAGIETSLLKLCETRTQEIAMIHGLLKAAGLQRAPETRDGR
jgi:hypothetical protein